MLNILITGANGQLGSSLRQLGSVSPNNYLATDVAELTSPTPGRCFKRSRNSVST
ncbi:MAG: hypothetical protein ACLSAM_14725 [Alistipes onderdonkii]